MTNNNLNSSGIDVSKIAESKLEQFIKQHDTKDTFNINWSTDFENGFLNYLDLAINPELKKGYFGLGAENRPKIVDLNTKDNAQTVEGYRLVEFLPNHDNKSESYLFFGTPLELMTQISSFFNQWLLNKVYSDNKNGNISNTDSVPKNLPLQGIFIKIYLSTKKQPPYYKSKNLTANDYFSMRYVTIPVADRTKITYDNLRAVCNNSSGQNWGLYSARAYVKSELGIHQVVCGGSNEEVAVKNLEKFLTLTTAVQFRNISIRHDYNNTIIPKKFDVYPAYCIISNYEHITINNPNVSPKSNIPTQKRIIKHETINLYYDKPPSWINNRINEVLRIISKDKNTK
jgi:hypothetical protein